jgi:glycosyltransferase involved in cell wall biosynthesis
LNNKILIITYYWPPFGGSGVQRWLKFVKYLPSFGYQPFVFTPENPFVEIQDASLLKDVPSEAEIIKLPIWEPYQLFQTFSGKKKQADFVTTGKTSFVQKLSLFARGNLFIPDARKFWVRPSVLFLHDFLKSNQVDTIITTGPPHSMHLIGLKLKQKNPTLKWIADFRDPWSEWDLLDTFSLTDWARKQHRSLERKVLTTADEVITIAPYHQQRLEALSGRKVELITNGFDEDDFKDIAHQPTEKFTLRHIGVVDELRDPRPMMEAIKELINENKIPKAKIVVEFIGNVNSRFVQDVQHDETLNPITSFVVHLPHHEVLKRYSTTDVQVLILAHTAIAPGNLPGKFFEYLASRNFIIGVGPTEGDAAAILRELRAGSIIERSNKMELKKIILQRYHHWQNPATENRIDASIFSRKNLTKQLVKILASLRA